MARKVVEATMCPRYVGELAVSNEVADDPIMRRS
jgi:hypothetical protein